MALLVRLTGIAALLLVLAAPAAGSAARTPPVRAMDIAERFWGASACNGGVEILTRQLRPTGVARRTDAWVTFGTPIGANNLVAAASTYSECTIALSRSRWPTRASMIEDWHMLCMTVTHEYGHLLGHAHEEEGLMAPVFSDYSSEPRMCRRARLA